MNMIDLSKARDLPTYELAELLDSISESSAELARRLGKSRTYVSKMRNAWRNACPSLRAAWKAENLSYDTVKTLARIESGSEQAKALTAYLKATKGKTRAAKGVAKLSLIERMEGHTQEEKSETLSETEDERRP